MKKLLTKAILLIFIVITGIVLSSFSLKRHYAATTGCEQAGGICTQRNCAGSRVEDFTNDQSCSTYGSQYICCVALNTPTPTPGFIIPNFQGGFSAYYNYAKQLFMGNTTSGNPTQTGIDYCAPDKLLPYFNNDMALAKQASCICQNESGAQPEAVANTCGRTNLPAGTSQEYSVGLFQMNMNVHPDYDSSCNKWLSAGTYCSVKDTQMRNCLRSTGGFAVAFNANKAYALYKNWGKSWRAWSTHVKCGLN